MDFNYAKPSFLIEEELPSFVKRDGQPFIDFVKTYYEWLERNIVIITLKSNFEITEDDIKINEVLNTSKTYLTTENNQIFILETQNTSSLFENNYSLSFGGKSGYTDYNGIVINTANNFTVSLFLKLNELPSVKRTDYDVITLSNTTYFSLLKILKSSNEIAYNCKNEDITTNISIEKDIWYMIFIRYNSSTKNLSYDIFSEKGTYSFSKTESLTGITNNRFVIGCDLYNSRNFLYSFLNDFSIFNKELSNNQITSLYNNGNPINPATANGLIHFYSFENENLTYITDSISSNNCNIYNDVSYIYDVPINIQGFVDEEESEYVLQLQVLSYIKYLGGANGVISDRIMIFANLLDGNLENDIVVKNTDKGDIIISSFLEPKNPLYVINNLDKFQDTDYIFNDNNRLINYYFNYLWKELMTDFPLYIDNNNENSIKDIIVKNIKDFYLSKGTFNSFNSLFKILYNEELLPNNRIYKNYPFEYTIVTKYYNNENIIDTIKNIIHPVGYKLNLLDSYELIDDLSRQLITDTSNIIVVNI